MTEVARRHETLRTCFPVKHGVACQEIASPSSLKPAATDLRHLPHVQREQEARQVLTNEAAWSFDLETGPLFRIHLVYLDETEHLLVLSMHHIISDGWSLRVMAGDIAEYYHAYQAGEQPRLPELPVQYADFAAWQREWLSGETLEHQLNYWKKQLQGASSLDLPTDHPRSAVVAQTCGVFPCALSEELTRKLKDLARTEGATLFMVLMAGFKLLLSWYAKTTDICVGTAIAGRTRGETEALVGFFINQLVVRTSLEGNPAFSELLRRVKESSLGAYAHQDVPFDKVIEAAAPERDSSRAPFIEVTLLLQNLPKADANSAKNSHDVLKIQEERFTPLRARFDMLFTLAEVNDSLKGTVEYRSELFQGSTIEMLWSRFENVLQAIVERPEAGLDALKEQLDRTGELALQQASADKLRGIRRRAVAMTTV
jgi:Condensation domain